MGLEKVKERVRHEARLKADATLKSARAEAASILAAAGKDGDSDEFEEKLSSEAGFIRKREEAAGRLEAKKMLLAFRKDFVDGVFSSVRERLAGLPDSVRREHLKKLLEKASSEIKVGTVYCSKKDGKYVKGRTVKETDLLGGLIAESPDGLLRVDYSYDSILKQVKDAMLPELNKFLFEKK